MRYARLIAQALRDIDDDPERPGSKEWPEVMIKGARTYHLEFSRERAGGEPVKSPRHLLVYRRRDDGVIEVGRILHDARDLARHLPQGYRMADDSDSVN